MEKKDFFDRPGQELWLYHVNERLAADNDMWLTYPNHFQ